MADSVTLKFSTDLSLVRRKLTNAPKRITDALDQEFRRIAEEAAQELRETTPGRGGEEGTGEWKSTGDLAEAWKAVPLPATRAGSRWGVVNTDPRANKNLLRTSKSITLLEALEFGTGPHKIKAVNEPLLVFYQKKSGRWRFEQEVQHFGTAPTHFIRRATVNAKRKQSAASRRLANTVLSSMLG